MDDNLNNIEVEKKPIVNDDNLSGKVKGKDDDLIKDCVEFVAKIIEKTKIVTYKQIRDMLRKLYGVDSELIEEIIIKGERMYLYLLTSDNYLIDYKHYELIADDRFHDNLFLNNSSCKCPFPIKTMLTNEDKDILNCLTVIANTMPQSANFCFVHYPWNVMFTTESKQLENGSYSQGCLYEIVCFHENDYVTKNILIRDGFRPKEEDRQFIKRIAILDNESYVKEISHSGYEKLIKVGNNGEIILIEKRDRAW